MKRFKNSFFSYLLCAGMLFSLGACGTDGDNNATNSPSTPADNNDGDGSENQNNNNNNNNGNTTSSNGNRTEASNFVHNLKIDVNPAKAILGDDSVEAVSQSRIMRAVTNEDNESLYSIRRTTDLVGGTYEEKDEYCSWTNFGVVYDDIADRIIGTCQSFSSSTEMFTMFKDYVPDDIEYGQSVNTVIAFNSMGTTIDIPMSFYINKEGSKTTFALHYEAMGNQGTMSIETDKISETKTKYTFKNYSPGRCDYLRVNLVPTTDPYGLYAMNWDESKQEYYYYGLNFSDFTVMNRQAGYKIPLTLIDNTSSYISYDSETGIVTNTYGSPLDLYAYDNNDGTMNLKAVPTQGGTNPTSGASTQRWVVKDSCSVSTWIDGESYERVALFDVPSYAMGYSNATFFKAYKDDDNHWRIYRSFGYEGNECFATQDEKGWYMLYDYSRNDVSGGPHASACKIGNIDGAEIGEYCNGESVRLKINAFEGFDEIRAAKVDTRLICNLFVNGQSVDAYYTTNGNAEIYRNGTRVFAPQLPASEQDDSRELCVDASSSGFKFRNYDYNCRAYGATLNLRSGWDNVNGCFYKHYGSESTSNYISSLGLTFKFGDLKSYLDKAQEVIDEAGDYINEFDFYNIPKDQQRAEFYQNLEENIYPLIDCKEELLGYFA